MTDKTKCPYCQGELKKFTKENLKFGADRLIGLSICTHCGKLIDDDDFDVSKPSVEIKITKEQFTELPRGKAYAYAFNRKIAGEWDMEQYETMIRYYEKYHK